MDGRARSPNTQQLAQIQERRRSEKPRDRDTTSVGRLSMNNSFDLGNKSMNKSVNRTFRQDHHNNSMSYNKIDPLNQTMIAKQEASMMIEKKNNVKASRQNMQQLKNRIEALKRNVEKAQKEEMKADRERSQLEAGIRNKEKKQMHRMA